jgi:nucleoid-associated protein YgaU
VEWGNATRLTSLRRGDQQSDPTFYLFKNTGEALRATLNLTVVEFLDPQVNLRETDPELTTRLVKRGDTLTNIAAEVYRDPALWRLIAEANGLDDPRRLEIGRRLTIPQL